MRTISYIKVEEDRNKSAMSAGDAIAAMKERAEAAIDAARKCDECLSQIESFDG